MTHIRALKRSSIHTFAIVLLLLLGSALHAQNFTQYYSVDEMPDASIILPAPADTNDLLFVDDFNQWVWGKSVRNTPRGQQASWESLWSAARMADIFGQAMGIKITAQETPAMWRLLHRVAMTGDCCIQTAKEKYMRTRPFARMHEHLASEFDNEEELSHNGSYPSGHTMLGWCTALAMAEMAPEQQDTILRRGYQYGESRVIVGAHWQSDVEAGRLSAAAAIARMRTSQEYRNDLAAARAEYCKLKGIRTRSIAAEYPNGRRVLDAPIDTAHIRFYGDLTQYWQGKAMRETPRGRQAILEVHTDKETILRTFSPYMGVALSAENTPHIAALVKELKSMLNRESSKMKKAGFRRRPYVQMNEPTLIPEEEDSHRGTSSYPSSHACLGWGIALVLAEVAPEHQEDILIEGLEYGKSRIIAGYHYASDVLAGQHLATLVVGRMHCDPAFLTLLDNAREEYRKLQAR